MSLYDAIAELYDPWSRSVVEDIGFYVEEALASGGPVVELAVGTGRIAVPTAKAGFPVIGVDASAGMLDFASDYARAEGVPELLYPLLGDLREPPVPELVPSSFVPIAPAHDDRADRRGARRRTHCSSSTSSRRAGRQGDDARLAGRHLRARRLGRERAHADISVRGGARLFDDAAWLAPPGGAL